MPIECVFGAAAAFRPMPSSCQKRYDLCHCDCVTIGEDNYFISMAVLTARHGSSQAGISEIKNIASRRTQ
jgi:hypothetical protein